jgi:hypothetical protein
MAPRDFHQQCCWADPASAAVCLGADLYKLVSVLHDDDVEKIPSIKTELKAARAKGA